MNESINGFIVQEMPEDHEHRELVREFFCQDNLHPLHSMCEALLFLKHVATSTQILGAAPCLAEASPSSHIATPDNRNPEELGTINREPYCFICHVESQFNI